MGYHITPISRGIYGKPSKIVEECDEFEDAILQDCALMALQELSDMIGAIRGYLEAQHPSMTLEDLIKMSDITRRAFEDGTRSTK